MPIPNDTAATAPSPVTPTGTAPLAPPSHGPATARFVGLDNGPQPGEATTSQSDGATAQAMQALQSAEQTAAAMLAARPLMSLSLAAGTGALLGWWIKRR